MPRSVFFLLATECVCVCVTKLINSGKKNRLRQFKRMVFAICLWGIFPLIWNMTKVTQAPNDYWQIIKKARNWHASKYLADQLCCLTCVRNWARSNIAAFRSQTQYPIIIRNRFYDFLFFRFRWFGWNFFFFDYLLGFFLFNFYLLQMEIKMTSLTPFWKSTDVSNKTKLFYFSTDADAMCVWIHIHNFSWRMCQMSVFIIHNGSVVASAQSQNTWMSCQNEWGERDK